MQIVADFTPYHHSKEKNNVTSKPRTSKTMVIKNWHLFSLDHNWFDQRIGTGQHVGSDPGHRVG